MILNLLELIVSTFEALFIALFLGAVVFNFRSVKAPIYCLIGFAIAASMPEPSHDLEKYLLGLAGVSLTAGLILRDWKKAWTSAKSTPLETTKSTKPE